MSFPRYERYKESGVEWLGEVPDGWEVKSIKQIVATPITDGPHETPVFFDEGIPFVSAEAVSSGKIDFTKIRGFISESVHKGYSQKYCPQFGDIYMVKSGATTGITAIVDTDIEFNIWSPLAAIRCGKKAVPQFVLNFMRSKNFQEAVTLNWSFGTQQNIGMGVIENLSIAIPPLPEQQTIAAFLDRETGKIDELVAEQERLIALLKEKRQAVISHAVTKGLNPDAPMKDSGIEWLGAVPVGWEVCALKRVASLKSGESITAETIEDVGEYPVYGGNGLRGYTDTLTHNGYFALIGRQGALCGNINYAQGKFWASEHAVVVSPVKQVETFWLGELLRSMNLNQYSVSAAQPGLSVEIVNNLLIPVPPLPEQQTIAAFLDSETAKIDTLVAEAQKAIGLLKERRSALISAAVTGKIDVRNHIPLTTGEA